MLERLVRDKHSNLLQKFVNYGRKKNYSIGDRIENAASKTGPDL
jgi:hypothetical protein